MCLIPRIHPDQTAARDGRARARLHSTSGRAPTLRGSRRSVMSNGGGCDKYTLPSCFPSGGIRGSGRRRSPDRKSSRRTSSFTPSRKSVKVCSVCGIRVRVTERRGSQIPFGKARDENRYGRGRPSGGRPRLRGTGSGRGQLPPRAKSARRGRVDLMRVVRKARAGDPRPAGHGGRLDRGAHERGSGRVPDAPAGTPMNRSRARPDLRRCPLPNRGRARGSADVAAATGKNGMPLGSFRGKNYPVVVGAENTAADRRTQGEEGQRPAGTFRPGAREGSCAPARVGREWRSQGPPRKRILPRRL
jgi:hypothetical protein